MDDKFENEDELQEAVRRIDLFLWVAAEKGATVEDLVTALPDISEGKLRKAVKFMRDLGRANLED